MWGRPNIRDFLEAPEFSDFLFLKYKDSLKHTNYLLIIFLELIIKINYLYALSASNKTAMKKIPQTDPINVSTLLTFQKPNRTFSQ
jgi:hypothetical protein